MLLTGLGIRNQKVRFHVVAFALLEDLVRAICVFILHKKNGIDEVLALQHPKAILPPESREYGAENKNSADKILKEGEGHDVESDFLISNAEARKEHIHE